MSKSGKGPKRIEYLAAMQNERIPSDRREYQFILEQGSEFVSIDSEVEITIVDVGQNRCVLRITAPASYLIARGYGEDGSNAESD